RAALVSRAVKVRGRWITHTLSCASTARPEISPNIQLLGSGCGQNGSTLNCGAASAAAAGVTAPMVKAMTRNDRRIRMAGFPPQGTNNNGKKRRGFRPLLSWTLAILHPETQAGAEHTAERVVNALVGRDGAVGAARR